MSTLFNFVPHVYITNRGAARGGQGGPEPPRNLEARLPKPIQNMGWADYARHITASPPGFKILSTPLTKSQKKLSEAKQRKDKYCILEYILGFAKK